MILPWYGAEYTIRFGTTTPREDGRISAGQRLATSAGARSGSSGRGPAIQSSPNSHPVTRRAFLATVRHHLRGNGIAVFQQNPPDWFAKLPDAEPVRDDPGGIRRIVRAARWEPPCMHVEVEYRVGESTWTHAWASYQISDEELAGGLAEAGLRFGGWLTGDHAWFTARPSA